MSRRSTSTFLCALALGGVVLVGCKKDDESTPAPTNNPPPKTTPTTGPSAKPAPTTIPSGTGGPSTAPSSTDAGTGLPGASSTTPGAGIDLAGLGAKAKEAGEKIGAKVSAATKEAGATTLPSGTPSFEK